MSFNDAVIIFMIIQSLFLAFITLTTAQIASEIREFVRRKGNKNSAIKNDLVPKLKEIAKKLKEFE